MGATDTVNAVEQGLDARQKADLLKILEKRKGELQEAIEDVDTAIARLKGGATPPPPTA